MNDVEIKVEFPRRDLALIKVPTPFGVGRANCILIKRDPLTVVDCGTNTDRSYSALVRGLAQAGVEPRDLQRIVITHLHLDHSGLVQRLVDASGAQVLCHPRLIDQFAELYEHWKIDNSHIEALSPYLGLSPEPARMQRRIAEMIRNLGCEYADALPLNPGESLEFDGASWQVLHTPGHTPYCLSLYDRAGRTLISGDFLLEKITPNPLLHRPSEPGALGLDALVMMLDSLAKIRSLKIDSVLPGHGSAFGDPRLLIQSQLQHRRQRHGQLLDALEPGPLNAHELIACLFPNLPPTEIFLGLSEVMAHVGLALHNNELCCEVRDGLMLFSRSKVAPGSSLVFQ
ncbi:MAG: MBL fold metallo-hydrolase [Candidatus Alcyoniella australis]|nr:MBL fold metallo-hydrolase [Candidatus Alcyoniella australis]